MCARVCTYICTYRAYSECGFILYARSAEASAHMLWAQYNRMLEIDVVLYLCVTSVSRKGRAGPPGARPQGLGLCKPQHFV